MLLWLLCHLGLGARLPHGKEAERQQSSACLCPQPDPGCSQTQEQADRFINSLQRSFGLFIYPAANSVCCINPHLEIIQRNPPAQPSPTGLRSSSSPAAPQAVWGHKFQGPSALRGTLSTVVFEVQKSPRKKQNAVKNKVIYRFCAQRAQEAVKHPSTLLSLPPCCTPHWHMVGGGVLHPSRPSVPTTVPSLTPRISLQGTRLLAPPAAWPFEALSLPSSLGKGHSPRPHAPLPTEMPPPEEVLGSTAQHSPRASTGPEHPLP